MKTRIIIVLIALIALFTSCSEDKTLNKSGISNIGEDVQVRAKVLGGSVITYVDLSYKQSFLYKATDTVMIDLNTHRIIETANEAGEINFNVVLLERTDY